jgi:hypothetical protein
MRHFLRSMNLLFCGLLLCGLWGAAACTEGGGASGLPDTVSPTPDVVVPPGDDTAHGDTPDGAATDCSPACNPAACEICVDGRCVSACGVGSHCVGGVCEAIGTPECEIAENCLPCHDCVDEVCVFLCDDGMVCVEGACVPPADCSPACGPCEVCDTDGDGPPACVSTCGPEERCVDDACVLAVCTPACDPNLCQTCDRLQEPPVCVSRCDTLQCQACDGQGACRLSCDEATCERCDGDGNCVDRCDALMCVVCDGQGECQSTCDAAACEVCDGQGACGDRCLETPCHACDGAGDCYYLCDHAACEFCDEVAGECRLACDPALERCVEGGCELMPTVICEEEDGFCDGSFVSALEIAPKPSEQDEEPGCCCDLTGDGEVNNALAGVIDLLGGFLQTDLDYFNRSIAAEIQSGALILLFEFIGVDSVEVDEYVVFNTYLGEDPQGTPERNLAGLGEFLVKPESLDPSGYPLMAFVGATIDDSWLRGGPSRFIVPLNLMGDAPPLLFVVEGARITARIWQEEVGFRLSDGEVCGYVSRARLVQGFNEFVATNCDCLNLTQPLVSDTGTALSCVRIPAANITCDPADYMEDVCRQLASSCGALTTLLPNFFDIDTNGDGRRDALSLGVRFSAVSARIVGVASTED